MDGAPCFRNHAVALAARQRVGLHPARDWRVKYHEYEASGVREYWIVDPLARRVEAYALTGRKRYRVIPEAKGAFHSTALRGFFLKPSWLWESPRPKVRALLGELGVT